MPQFFLLAKHLQAQGRVKQLLLGHFFSVEVPLEIQPHPLLIVPKGGTRVSLCLQIFSIIRLHSAHRRMFNSYIMTSAIIVAAGKGTRMGPNMDKLFMPVAGRPVIAHTWGRFDSAGCIDEIIVVVRDGMQNTFTDLARQYGFKKKFKLTVGGKERQDSVWNGLQSVSPEADIVAIQDGARPCTSVSLITGTVEAARQTGAAVAAHPVADTIKASDDGQMITRHLERSRLWAVQTPQTFRVEVIKKALSQVRAKGIQVTDDTAACEVIGQPVKLVWDKNPNPKVTVREDLPYVEVLLKTLQGALA